MGNESNEYRSGLQVPPAGGVSPVRRIERKRKKVREGDGVWRDILSETLASEPALRSNPVGSLRESSEEDATPQAGQEPEFMGEHDFDGSEREFESMIEEIRKMSENPEGLIESHLSVFTDPAPPGKLLNSQG